MAYDPKEWEDRQSQYPNRRKLVETDLDDVYEIERAEGEVTETGNRFNAENMNDLERRVAAAFANLNDSEITVQDKNNHFTSAKLNGVLDELFTFAGDGKKAIAAAIGTTQGGTATQSMSFAQLAALITNYNMTFYATTFDKLLSGGLDITLIQGQSKSYSWVLPINFQAQNTIISSAQIDGGSGTGSDAYYNADLFATNTVGQTQYSSVGYIKYATLKESTGKSVFYLAIYAYEKMRVRIYSTALVQIHGKGY